MRVGGTGTSTKPLASVFTRTARLEDHWPSSNYGQSLASPCRVRELFGFCRHKGGCAVIICVSLGGGARQGHVLFFSLFFFGREGLPMGRVPETPRSQASRDRSAQRQCTLNVQGNLITSIEFRPWHPRYYFYVIHFQTLHIKTNSKTFVPQQSLPPINHLT